MAAREGVAMAQSVTVTLIDDLDQSQAAQTVRFGVDGTGYEIDLSDRHASELRSMLSRYIGAARRLRQAPARARPRPQHRTRTRADREQSRRIRSWAMDKGLLASPRGRIPRQVVDEYEDSLRVASVPVRSPGTAPEPATGGGTTRTRRGRAPRAAQSQQSAARASGRRKTTGKPRG